MSQPLFEQYKAALRRGHVALLGGSLEAAADAYREAAKLVPDRAPPLASLGTVLYRMGRTGEGEAAFESALRLAPLDEATLLARATARREVGLAADAASDLEQLALNLEAAGRREEALTHAQTAHVLAPSGNRAALLERLSAQPPGRSFRPQPGPPPLKPPAAASAAVAGASGATAAWPAIDLPSAPPPSPDLDQDPETVLAEAAALLEAGDPAGARDRMLAAAAIHRAAGRPDAALDVCFQLLVIAPGDPAVHLAIAGLQLDRGWQSLAADKIKLLLRLTGLTGDTQAAADAHALAAERLRDGPGTVATGR